MWLQILSLTVILSFFSPQWCLSPHLTLSCTLNTQILLFYPQTILEVLKIKKKPSQRGQINLPRWHCKKEVELGQKSMSVVLNTTLYSFKCPCICYLIIFCSLFIGENFKHIQSKQSSVALVACCYVTSHHQRSSLKQLSFIISVSIGQESGHGLSGPPAQRLTRL